MSEQDRNNPLHGVGLDAMFSEILRHYHWEILSEQLKFKCLESNPSFAAATKFLKKTKWAREKTEAFYLYRFKQLPIPSDEEHLLPPRERRFESGLAEKEPVVIKTGDKQFFDDPISGPKFNDKVPYDVTRGDKKPYEKPSRRASSEPKPSQVGNDGDDMGENDEQSANPCESQSSGSSDPWGKWRK